MSRRDDGLGWPAAVAVVAVWLTQVGLCMFVATRSLPRELVEEVLASGMLVGLLVTWLLLLAS